MKLTHYTRKEKSGLFVSTLEWVNGEEKAGHQAAMADTQTGDIYYPENANGHISDVDIIHSQFPLQEYHSGKPTFMVMHGEPLSSVGNGVSMKAIVDLAPVCDAFICMRKEEHSVWNSIKRTYLVRKGIDLERFKPMKELPEGIEKLSGSPAVLYAEHWRGQRNPLYLCKAMEIVWKQLPDARLHLYNCTSQKMSETFKALITNNKWWTFIRTIAGPEADVNLLYNRADMVVSCLYPLYARGIEAFGAGKAFIGPGYREEGYPWTCELDPEDMARAIIETWEGYDKINYREWAEARHDVDDTVKECMDVYNRYL